MAQTASDPSRFEGLLGGWGGALGALTGRSVQDQRRQERPAVQQAPQPSPDELIEAVLEMEPKKLRLLAARMYPFISQRIKTELVKDRERAGMITGLHR